MRDGNTVRIQANKFAIFLVHLQKVEVEIFLRTYPPHKVKAGEASPVRTRDLVKRIEEKPVDDEAGVDPSEVE